MRTPLTLLAAALSVGLFGIACGGGDAASAPDAAAAGQDAAPADTWSSFAQGFFDDYCNSCHSPDGSGYRNGELDFRSYDLVVDNAAEIRCGTAETRPDGCSGFPPPQQFPIQCPCPDATERARLVDWIEAGTPE